MKVAKKDCGITRRSLPASVGAQSPVSKGCSRNDVLRIYHVSHQARWTNSAEDCFFGDAPTLGFLNETYGDGTAQEWLVYQLDDFSEYCGAREKLTSMQMQTLAELISQEYAWLKVTEIMLFFRRFKLGRYQRLFGVVDPMAIASSLSEFLKDRNDAYYDYNRMMEHETRVRPAETGLITWEQFCKDMEKNLRVEARQLEEEGKHEEARAKYEEAGKYVNRPHPLQHIATKK